MDTLIKSDIFFFVTTVSVALVTVFLLVILYYVIMSLRRMRELCDKVEENIDTANVHVKEIVAQIKESFLFNLFFRKRKNNKNH